MARLRTGAASASSSRDFSRKGRLSQPSRQKLQWPEQPAVMASFVWPAFSPLRARGAARIGGRCRESALWAVNCESQGQNPSTLKHFGEDGRLCLSAKPARRPTILHPSPHHLAAKKKASTGSAICLFRPLRSGPQSRTHRREEKGAPELCSLRSGEENSRL